MGISYTTYQAYSNALLIADVPNTNFWTQADALFSLQKTQRYVYKMYCEADDDYFRTDIYFPASSLLQDGVRQYMNYLALPSDFYRLRQLQYQNVYGGSNAPFRNADKMSGQNYGNTQQVPAYRMIGSNIPAYQYNPAIQYNSGQYVSGGTSTGGVSTIWQTNSVIPAATICTPPTATYWTTITTNITYYNPETPYAVGTYVLGGGGYGTTNALYLSILPVPIGTTQAPPNATYWTTVSASALAPYSTASTYTAGTYVLGTAVYGTLNTVFLSAQNVPAASYFQPGTYPGWTQLVINPTGYLALYDPVGYQTWAMGYYPQPPAITINVAGTTGTDIGAQYPDNLPPEIFAYQIAVDIRIKAKLPPGDVETQLKQMVKTLSDTMLKDNNKPEPMKDVFASGFAPWV